MADSNGAVKDTLRKFIVQNFLFGADSKKFGDEESFLEKGIVDSTGILELVSFIEETYNFKMKDEELLPENLDSINNLVKFLESKGIK